MNKLYQSIPKHIKGWKAGAKDEIYNRETLYEYINGGAELYLTYCFQEVFARRFLHSDSSEIVLDIYDMGSSEDAYGIFSCEREDEDVGIGQDSEYGGGLLQFWKDRYFVSIIAIGDEKSVKPAILELGQTVASAINSTGKKPKLLSLLPEKGLQCNNIRYFHSHVCLNNFYFLANENILHITNDTDCIFASYHVGGDTGYLLLLQYESDSQANSAYESFLTYYMPEARETGIARMENNRWTVALCNQSIITIIFDVLDKEWALDILSDIRLNKR